MFAPRKAASPLKREARALGDSTANSVSLSGELLKSSDRPEAQLLLACARTNVDPLTAERIKCCVRAGIDWDYFLNKTYQHFLTPLVYRSLSTVCSADVPEEVLNRLRERANYRARHNLYRTGELIKLVGLLENHGIPVMPFKGPTLSVLAYGNLGLREYGDLDILVHRRDVLRAQELFLRRGYRLASLHNQIGLNSDLSPRAKDLIFESEDHGVRVELHWQLMERHFGLPLDLDGFWKQLQRVPLAGDTVLTLAPEVLLLYLCMHGSSHKWSRLLWVCDVSELVRAHPGMDWTKVVEQARKLGCEGMLTLGLLLAKDLLGTRVADGIWQKVRIHSGVKDLAAQVRELHFSQGDRSEGFFYPYHVHLTVRERRRDRMRLRLHYYYSYLRRAIVPNDRDRAIVSLPALLSPLYYLLRPLRLIGGFRPGKLR